MDTEALMPRGQEMLDRRKRRRLDDVDHDRRGQHRHQSAADAGRGVLDGDLEFCRSGEAGSEVR
jgi:hypothetical protein